MEHLYSTAYSSPSTYVPMQRLLTVCVRLCARARVCSVWVCVFTFTSHVNTAEVSSSVSRHVMDTCRRRVRLWATNRSLSRHEPACLFSLLASLPPSSNSFTLTFTLPSPLPSLPLTLSTSRPVFLSLRWAHLRNMLESEPRHRLYPAELTWTRLCFCHVHAILFQLANSRLV